MSVEVNTELSMNKLNKRDPAMEPWGTPACTFFCRDTVIIYLYWMLSIFK